MIEVYRGEITSISLLTDAKKGIAKYTVFGISPGVSREVAQHILVEVYHGEEPSFIPPFEDTYFIDRSNNGYYYVGVNYYDNDTVNLIVVANYAI